MSRPRLLALLLALVTLAVFLPVGRFGFVDFDDNDYVTGNPFVKNGLTATDIHWAFTAFYANNWHPLTWLSHMLDCELFGLNAGAHHFDNVLLHAANVALLFLLIRRLTRQLWPAAFIAALFAWHPLHVESVAWIAERKDVLSTFFALLALLSYVKSVAEEKPAAGLRIARHASHFYWLALFFFALGLMAKPMLVTLPFLLLLLDFWPLGRFSQDETKNLKLKIKNFGNLVREKIPFFALTVISCLITYLAQGKAVASFAGVPLGYRLENAPVATMDYILKLLWPANLCVFYPLPDKLPALEVIVSIAVLLLISPVAWHWRKSRPYFLMGWLWFLGTLIPVIGLVQVGVQAMADRYTYIPSIGFFIAVVFLLGDFTVQVRMSRAITGGLMALTCAACILVTEHQLQFWRNGETLFRRALVVNPHDGVALLNLGVALGQEGRYDEALVMYREAEKITPKKPVIHSNIASILSFQGHHEEALAEYRQAIALHPGIAFQYNAAAGELAILGQLDAALSEYSAASQCDPKLAGPHIEAAKILFQLGRDPGGIAEFRAAVRLDPDNYQTLATVAHYLAASENPGTRDGKNALPLAIQANELSGHSQPMVFDILGMALAETGDFTNAISCAQTALDLATAAHVQNTAPISARIELYRKNLPWRESFRTATNAPAVN